MKINLEISALNYFTNDTIRIFDFFHTSFVEVAIGYGVPKKTEFGGSLFIRFLTIFKYLL